MAIRAFISDSHKDADLLTQLHEHLSARQRQQLLDTWTDREIHAGGVIDDDVKNQMDKAEIYLLLVSSAFIQSDYCFEKEFARACERQQAGKAIIVPVIVRECDWKSPALRRFKALPEDGKPVMSRHWHSTDEALANVAAGLRALIERGPLSKSKHENPDKPAKEKFIPDEQHVTEAQRADLRKIAEEVVDRLTAWAANEPDEVVKKRKGRNFGIVWSQFNEHFNTVEHGLPSLPREKFDEAKSWLLQYKASKNKNFKRTNPQKYRNTLLTAARDWIRATPPRNHTLVLPSRLLRALHTKTRVRLGIESFEGNGFFAPATQAIRAGGDGLQGVLPAEQLLLLAGFQTERHLL